MEERKFFHDVGVKSSDIFYHNDDKVQEKRTSLRNQSKDVAAKLNEEQYSKIQDKKKKMAEQALKR